MALNLDSEQKVRALNELFERIDRNGDQAITLEEIGLVMRQFGRNPSQAELTFLVEHMDYDGSGEINRPEFVVRFMQLVDDGFEFDDNHDLATLLQKFAVGETGRQLRADYLFEALGTIGEPLSQDELADLKRRVGWQPGDKYVDLQAYLEAMDDATDPQADE